MRHRLPGTTHDWQKIQQYTLWPEQKVYERLRPLVLFGETAAGRTLHYQADQFDQQGMGSLFHKESPLLLIRDVVSRQICAN